MKKRLSKQKIKERMLNKMTDAVTTFHTNYKNVMENLLIEGLARKGYTFNNKEELELFVKDNCQKVEYFQSGQIVYLVQNTPFFIHFTEQYKPSFVKTNKDISLKASFGSYAFLGQDIRQQN